MYDKIGTELQAPGTTLHWNTRTLGRPAQYVVTVVADHGKTLTVHVEPSGQDVLVHRRALHYNY